MFVFFFSIIDIDIYIERERDMEKVLTELHFTSSSDTRISKRRTSVLGTGMIPKSVGIQPPMASMLWIHTYTFSGKEASLVNLPLVMI